MTKRIISFVLVVFMLVGMLPTNIYAAEHQHNHLEDVVRYADPESVSYTNTLHTDSSGELPQLFAAPMAAGQGDTATFTSAKEAGAYLREEMVGRATSVTFRVDLEGVTTSDAFQTWFNTVIDQIYQEALSHTGIGKEGDYIRAHLGAGESVSFGGNGFQSAEGRTSGNVTATFVYLSTAEQEAQVDAKLPEVMPSILDACMTDYGKIQAVYQYICENIDYDHSLVEHSAYAGLIGGSCVCQGYASLLYRMLLEAGIDARYVTGTGNGGLHAWNVVELDGSYYCMDVTWDGQDAETRRDYFLKGTGDFPDHVLDSNSASLLADYSLSAVNYAGDTTTNRHSYVNYRPLDDMAHMIECACGEFIQKTHTMENGVCTGCGYEEIADYTLVLAGGKVTKNHTDEEVSVPGISWDGTKWIFEDVSYVTSVPNAIRFEDENAIVKLVGANVIQGGDAAEGSAHGMYAIGNLTIEGSGSLDVTTGDAQTSNYGLFVNGNLTIQDGTIHVATGSSGGNAYGVDVCANASFNGGSITSRPGSAGWASMALRFTGESVGIHGASVTAIAGAGSQESFGFMATTTTVDMTSGSLYAEAVSGGLGRGIFCNINYQGGSVTAWASEYGVDASVYTSACPSRVLVSAGSSETDCVLLTDWVGDGTEKINLYRYFQIREDADSHTITVTNDGNGTAAAEPAWAAPGAEITLSATANEGFHFQHWEVVSGGMTVENNRFLMPDANVQVKAVFEAHTCNIWSSDGAATHSGACIDCGEVLSVAHTMENGVCTFCGDVERADFGLFLTGGKLYKFETAEEVFVPGISWDGSKWIFEDVTFLTTYPYAVVFDEASPILELRGSNQVTGGDSTGHVLGIISLSGLTIQGTGSLEITVGTAGSASTGIECTGDLTINSGTISVNASYSAQENIAIQSGGSVYLNGGSIVAVAGDSAVMSRGIYARYDIMIRGADVYAAAGTGDSGSIALSPAGNTYMESGNLYLEAINGSNARCILNTLKYSGGTVEAMGGTYAMNKVDASAATAPVVVMAGSTAEDAQPLTNWNNTGTNVLSAYQYVKIQKDPNSHSITVNQMDGGVVVTDQTWQREGDTVHLTVQTTDEFHLLGWSTEPAYVADSITKTGTEYTFPMAGENVTITPIFEAHTYDETYHCTVCAEAQKIRLWICGQQVSFDQLSGQGWTFDPETNTLTLEEFYHDSSEDVPYDGSYINGVIESDLEHLTVTGTASIKAGSYVYDDGNECQLSPIYAFQNLNIVDADLQLTSQKEEAIDCDQNLTITGSTMTAYGGTKSDDEGITVGGNLQITGSTIYVYSYEADDIYDGEESILVSGGITIDQSQVYAYCTEEALEAVDLIVITDSILNLSSYGTGNGGSTYPGIDTETGLEIKGSAVSVLASGNGLYAATVEMYDSVVYAQASTAGFYGMNAEIALMSGSTVTLIGSSGATTVAPETTATLVTAGADAASAVLLSNWAGDGSDDVSGYTYLHLEPETPSESAPVVYTVIFDANGGSGVMPTVMVSSGTFDLPVCSFQPQRGMMFQGWSTAKDGQVITESTVEITADTTFYAIWQSLPLNTITFDANGGSGTMEPVQAPGYYLLPQCGFTAPEGKQFWYWSDTPGGETVLNYEVEMTQDITLYAVWKDAVTIAHPTIEGYNLVWLESFENLSIFPQGWSIEDKDGDGYNWYIDDEFGSHCGDGYLVSASYDDNNARALSPDNWLYLPPQTLDAQEEYMLSFVIQAVDSSYPDDLIGVYVSTDGGETYTQLGSDHVPTEEAREIQVDLSAYSGQTVHLALVHHNSYDQFMVRVDCVGLWTRDLSATCAATFHANGGSGSMDRMIVLSGGTITLPECSFTAPQHHQFAGWATSPEGQVIVEPTVQLTADTTFYAIWEESPKYTVTFDANGGSGTMEPALHYAGIMDLPYCTFTAPEGKVFHYWSTDFDGGTYEQSAVMVTSDMTLYAIWADDLGHNHEKEGYTLEWYEGFENLSLLPQGWSIEDKDGDGYNWVNVNSGHCGRSAVESYSYLNNNGGLNPDNWLYLPSQTLENCKEYILSFTIKAYDQDYSKDMIGVYISTDGGQTYTQLGQDYEPTIEATQIEVDLSAYAGQTIGVALVHHNSFDQWAVTVDCVALWSKDGNHSGTLQWVTTGTTHKQMCSACGQEITAEEDHIWVEGVCSVCDYACQHTGGTATCQAPATCERCQSQYGEKNPSNHTAGVNWTKSETKHKQTYLCCGVVSIPEEDHQWTEGVCAVCGYICQHNSVTEATCTAEVICLNCDKKISDKNPDRHTESEVWNQTAATHEKRYPCCGTVTVAEAEHTWVEGVCSVCGYPCQHTGGAATCMEQAVCTTCGDPYGEKDSTNHTGTANWAFTDESHKKVYDCCGATEIPEAPHNMAEGTCIDCGYVCTHEKDVSTWIQTETTHKRIRSCCGTVVIPEAPHSFSADNVCSVCGYKRVVYGILVSYNENQGSASATHLEAAPGTLVTLSYQANEGYHLEGWEIDAADVTITDNTFVMPAQDVTITAVFAQHRYGQWLPNDNLTHTATCACGDTKTEDCDLIPATCQSPAVCQTCQGTFGEKNPNNHGTDALIYTDNGTDHSVTHACCNAVQSQAEPHSYVDGICICGALEPDDREYVEVQLEVGQKATVTQDGLATELTQEDVTVDDAQIVSVSITAKKNVSGGWWCWWINRKTTYDHTITFEGLQAGTTVVQVGDIYYKVTVTEPHVHSYASSTTEPTCTQRGYTTYTCTCGDSYVSDYVDALGHSYENGQCSVCGELEPQKPTTFDPKTFYASLSRRKVDAGKEVTIKVKTSTDVEYVTINGVKVTSYTSTSMRRTFTYQVDTSVVGTFDYEIYAYNADGAQSIAAETLQLTVRED